MGYVLAFPLHVENLEQTYAAQGRACVLGQLDSQVVHVQGMAEVPYLGEGSSQVLAAFLELQAWDNLALREVPYLHEMGKAYLVEAYQA